MADEKKARSPRRKTFASEETLISKVSKKLKKAGVGFIEEKDLKTIIDSINKVYRGLILSDNREDGDFFEIPGVCKVTIKNKPARLRRNPRKNEVVAKGEVRSVKLTLVKDLKKALEEEFRKAPPKALKEQEEEQNAALNAKSDKKAKGDKKGKKAKKDESADE